MPLPRRRLVAGLLAAVISGTGLAALAAPAGAAEPSSASTQDAPKGRKVATLEIITPNASVQRAGNTEFELAEDGQKLRVGDTIQTDATGFVEIVYADDSFTRLDVNTTFTIDSLTDDEGNRKIKGTVESGQTWNRVEALTENESFEQEGAGATAATTGTAFAYQCDGAGVCVLTTVVNGVTYTTVDGELQNMDPLLQCTATEVDDANSDLCAVPTELTQEALIANQWLMTNLFLDGLLGYEGPIFGVIVVENGVVTSVTPATPPAESTEPPGPPVVPDPSVDVTENESGLQDPGPQDEIVTDENNDVVFTINTGGATWIIFTELFDDDPNGIFGLAGFAAASGIGANGAYCEPPFGSLYYRDGEYWEEVETDFQYASDTEFLFEPSEIDVPLGGEEVVANEIGYSETGEFTFYVETADGVASDPETVEVTVYDDPYGGVLSTEAIEAPPAGEEPGPPATE